MGKRMKKNKTSKRIKMVLLILCVMLFVGMVPSVIPALAQEKKTTISWWFGSWYEATAKKLIPIFEKENPDVRVSLVPLPWKGMSDKLYTSLSIGKPGDVVNVNSSWFTSFAARGFFRNLDEHINELNKDDFFKGNWKGGCYKDSLYGVPYRTDSFVLFYNKDMFRKVGLSPEKPPKTWKELLSYAKRLTIPEEGEYGFVIIGSIPTSVLYFTSVYIWQNEGAILNEDRTKAVINQKPAVEAVRFWAELFNKHHVVPKNTLAMTEEAARRLFMGEKVAMFEMSPLYLQVLEKQAPYLLKQELVDTALLPRGKQQATTISQWNITIPKRAKNPEEAWRFIKFFTRTDIMAKFARVLPTRESAAKYPRFQTKLIKPAMEMLNYGHLLPEVPEWTKMQQRIYEELQNVLLKNKSAQQAMDDAAREINRILAR